MNVTFPPQTLKISASVKPINFAIGTPVARDYIDCEAFEGPYTVTPSEEAQTLAAKNKRMVDDVLVEAVPFGLATTEQINRLFRGDNQWL